MEDIVKMLQDGQRLFISSAYFHLVKNIMLFLFIHTHICIYLVFFIFPCWV